MNIKMNIGSPENRTQPLVPGSKSVARQRSERRIAVHLPLKVCCRDKRGTFEEDTFSENLCARGAAFVTCFDVAIGSDLEIRIPFMHSPARRSKADSETHGRIVHVADLLSQSQKVVGVQFTGPRFQRVFRSESVV